MAWAFDTASGAVGAGTTTLSWSHTIGSGSDRLLCLAGSSERGSPGPEVSSITYNSTGSTSIRVDDIDYAGYSNNTNLRYILDADLPAAGTYTVAVTYTIYGDDIAGEAASYTGIAQQPPEANNGNTANNATSISANLTTLTDNALLVVSGMSNHAQAHTPGDGLTQRREDQTAAYFFTVSLNDKNVATADVTTGSVSVGTAGRMAISMAAFEAEAGGGGWDLKGGLAMMGVGL